MLDRASPHRRTDYTAFYTMETRWRDMDIYGHMNNVSYMECFDSAVNRPLIASGALDLAGGTGPIGIVAQQWMHYFAEVTYPERVEVGLRIVRIGSSSLTWSFALFREGGETAAAQGGYVHVYIDRTTRRPVPLTPAHLEMAHGLTPPSGAVI